MSTVKSKALQEMRLIQGLQEMFPKQAFTQAELKHPTRDFVMRFYLDFLGNIGINTEVLCQVPSAMYEKFGDTYLIRRVMVILREVFNKILFGEPISPFHMLDLLQPSHGRTAAFFTAMCNFTSFCVGKLTEIDQYIDELQEEKEEFDRLIQRREAYRQQLNDEAQIRVQISDLETTVAKKQQELRKLAQDGNAADKRVAEKEDAIRAMEAKLEQLNKDFCELQQERANAEALVVKSPLAVKNQKSLLEQKLKEADEKTAAAKDMLTSKREISKKLETLGEELESRTCLLNKIIAKSKGISKDKEVTEELQKRLSKVKLDLDECNAERQKLRERESQLQETESGMLLRLETKKKEFQGMLKAMRRDLEEVKKQTSAEKMSIQNAIDKSYGEISRLVNTYSAVCKKYEDCYAALLLKEKSIGDKAIEELQEQIAKFEKEM